MSIIDAMKTNLANVSAARIGVVTGGSAIFRAVHDRNALPAKNQVRVIEAVRQFLRDLRVPGPMLLINYAGERARDIENGRRAMDSHARQMRAIFLLYLVAANVGVGGEGGPAMDSLIDETFQGLENVNILDGADQGDAITVWGGAVQYEDQDPRHNALIYQCTLFADFVRLRESS